MRKVTVRLIAISRHSDEPSYLYGLYDEPLTENGYTYNRNWGRFMCVQKVGKSMTDMTTPAILITSNPDLNLPQFPKSVIDGYFKEGITKATVRL